jgi:hypothetical protein
MLLIFFLYEGEKFAGRMLIAQALILQIQIQRAMLKAVLKAENSDYLLSANRNQRSIEATPSSKTNRKLSKQVEVAAGFLPTQSSTHYSTLCQSEVANKKWQIG